MREIKGLEVKRSKNYGSDNLKLSHLDDTGKCHVMISNYGEVTSASLNKTEVKKMIAWLDRWLAFKDPINAKSEEVKN